MNKKELEDHKVVATKMEWCELAETIMGLSNELYELRKYLKKNEIKQYETLIELYEAEKWARVQEESSGATYYGFTYGLDYTVDWDGY